uniref:filamin-B-like n=1 Tax=Callithrix jacchus TaxID=9483 RepID=UPI0023DD19A8|nr:filamin-B-like [Callithrix jacchus]
MPRCTAPQEPWRSAVPQKLTKENGVYLIDVKFNGTHILEAPSRSGEPGHGEDPGLVSAYGDCTVESVDPASKLWAITGGIWREPS